MSGVFPLRQLIYPVILVVGMFLASACGKKESELPQIEDKPSPLVQVGDRSITEEDFALEIKRRQKTGREIESVEKVLQDLIEREAMLQAASTSEAMDSPDVQHDLENQILSKWLDQTLQEQQDRITVTDEDLLEAYEQNKDSYTRPAMARLALLVRDVSSSPDQDAVDQIKKTLEQAVTKFKESPETATRNGRVPGFGAVAAESSEHAISRYRGGDIGWISEDQATHRWPETLIQTGFSLEVGDSSPVLQISDTLYVVMKSDWREAQVTPFEEAKSTLRRPMIRKKKEALKASFMSDLIASANVTVNAEKSAKLSIPEPVVPEPPRLIPVNASAPKTLSLPN